MNRFSRSLWQAGLAVLISSGLCLPVEAQSIGDKMVTFLDGQVSSRVGGGGSSDMATEALRVAGGEFYPGDLGPNYPGDGDSVWGTLVTVIRVTDGVWYDSYPDSACQPGDVLQFGGSAKINDVSYPTRFTAVARTVNDKKRPSAVYQQNFNSVRTVKTAAIDVTQLSQGWIRIYRPIARVDADNSWKFTVVNNTPSSQPFTVMFGITTVSSQMASSANTSGSFYVFKITTDGTVPCVVNNDNTIYVETGKGNEIISTTSNTTGLGQLSD